MRRRAVAWLPVLIRLTALGYLAFFVPNLMLAATDRISTLPPLLGRLFDWGEGRGDPAVAVMFCTVYVVWAIFLFRSARDPSANRLFLDFNLTANAAHFAVMLVMAVTMPDEHQHIAGVIALGVISTVPLAACWLPVRSSNSVRLDDRAGSATTARHNPATAISSMPRPASWSLA